MALDIPTCSGLHTRFDHYACHYGLPQLQHWVLAGMRRFHNRAGATLVATRALEKELRGHGFACVQQLARAVDTTRFHPRHRDPALRHAWGTAADQFATIAERIDTLPTGADLTFASAMAVPG